MSGSLAVQTALIVALKAAEVAGGRVYDHVPGGVVHPYVDLGETQAIKADVQCRDGEDEFRTLHIWSRYRGQKELHEIADAIKAAVHGKSLDVAGRDSARVTVRDLRTLEDQDGLTQHGVLTIRIRHFGPKES